MSLEFTFSHSTAAVFDLFCDPDFLVQRSTALGELSADAEVDQVGNKIIIKMRREVKRDLPSFLAKIFNPQQVLSVTEEWLQMGETFVGKSNYVVEGQPVTVTTEMTLKPSANGSVFSITYKAKASIPLIGGKIEKYIISQCEEGTHKECEYAAKRLAG